MHTINEIATMGSFTKKPTKAEAFKLFTTLLSETDHEDLRLLAKLYSFFLPPVPKTSKTPEEWVAQALASDKDNRTYLRVRYSDGKYLTAADGHRMHRISTSLPEGFYDAALNKVEIGETYPTVSRLFIDAMNGKQMEIEAGSLPIELCEDGTTHAYRLPNCARVKKEYWDQATATANTSIIFATQARENGAVYLYLGAGREALIMPLYEGEKP